MAWEDILLPIVLALSASSGFWAYLIGRKDRSSQSTKLLMGLAHNHIIENGIRVIERGWVYRDEYDDLMTYSYEPYKELGGNGMCEKVMREVNRLPVRYRRIPKGGEGDASHP